MSLMEIYRNKNMIIHSENVPAEWVPVGDATNLTGIECLCVNDVTQGAQMLYGQPYIDGRGIACCESDTETITGVTHYMIINPPDGTKGTD